jgi:dihydrofolate synthase / folylpolyglutamate synthase
MNFDQAKAYLDQALMFGIKPGLHRMTRLMELLGNPEQKLRCIHIAGTNGKGSVSCYCASILAAAGLKTGLYTSPYLERLTERIRVVDGRSGLDQLGSDETYGEISQEELAAALTQVDEAVRQMIGEGFEHPTEFELITAVGFMNFAAAGCQVVVLETGLGGRLDSTNVISQPLACIITALGYDHMDRLGATISDIAFEKAGIIKAGCPVYLYDPAAADLSPEDSSAAAKIIEQRCSQMEAPLQVVRRQDLKLLDYGWGGQSFVDQASGLTLKTSLLGLFQPMNAVLAERACLDLGLAGESAVQDGIRLARWPARLEILRAQPRVLLDGCHNPQGCRALADALSRLLPGQPILFLAGMLQDKDTTTMLEVVLGHGGYCPASFICTAPANPRALPPGQLAEKVRQIAIRLPSSSGCSYNISDAISIAESPAAGARMALRLAENNSWPVCVFGSLYLAGNIRSHLMIQEDPCWTGRS